jgi:peptidoglycan/LPS O-acetylase OafA/YrhL
MSSASGRSIQGALDRPNAFDLLRLVAAVLVIVSHSRPLTGRPGLTVLGMEPAVLGVAMFFGISGFLVAKSWDTDPRPLAYGMRRGLRLMPALIVSALLTAFVLGPAVTDLSVTSYFQQGATYLYVAKDAVLVTFGSHLPGVFEHNPYPVAVNGSLWTLPVEALAYLALALLGVAGLLRRSWPLLLSAAAAIVLALALGRTEEPGVVAGHTEAVRLAAQNAATFFVGASLYGLRRSVPLTIALAIPAALLLWLTRDSSVQPLAVAAAVPYLVVALAHTQPARALMPITRPGDVSYGVYIYAFPIQQTLAHAFDGISATEMTLATIPLAWLLGLASWRLVERPALARKPARPA